MNFPSSQYQNQFLEIWYNQDSDARKTIDHCFFESFVTTPVRSIGILIEKITPVVSEKIQFEYLDKSKCIAPFRNFAPSGFCCKEENQHLLNLNISSKINFFDWCLNGRNWPVTNGETWFWKTRWFKTENLQCVCGHQDFTARIQIKNSSIESSTTTVRLSIDTSMREIKPEATQNFKFED